MSYNLSLVNTSPAVPANSRMFFQIISIDGVAPDLSRTQPSNWGQLFGGKVNPVPCPGVGNAQPQSQAACAQNLLMMPTLAWNCG